MDEENKEKPQEDTPENEKTVAEVKQPTEPTTNDYTAGVLLANGIIWLWIMSLTMFSGFTSRINPAILADFSFFTFIIAGFISSQQVAKRSKRNQLIISLRSALYSWAGSLVMMLMNPSYSSISSALTLLVCLLLGAVAGSYMLIRFRISERRKRMAEASS